MIVRYRPAIYAYESLTLSTAGKRGAIAKIVGDMIKCWHPIEQQITLWLPPHQSVRFQAVNPQNTSKIHRICGKTIDRHCAGTVDYGYCPACRILLDAHVNAAENIARRGIET